MAVNDPEIMPAPHRFRYFTSYAHGDQPLANKFDQAFSTALSAVPGYSFEKWRDVEALLPGDHWFDEIQNGLARSDFGLLLVSNHFLSSDFIRSYELPWYVPEVAGAVEPSLDGKFCIPVGLQPVVNSDALNARLGGRQVYLYQQTRWFGDCTGPQRVHFVNTLANRLLQILARQSAAVS